MRPSLYSLESTVEGAKLYLGEVSTEDCLQVFDPSDVVVVTELGATVSGEGWFDRDQLPSLDSVGVLLSFLHVRSDLDVIDFSARVGHVQLSTHDDGEAALVFESLSESLAFLRRALEVTLAEQAIGALLKHPGKYIELGDRVRIFATFEEYVAHTQRRARDRG